MTALRNRHLLSLDALLLACAPFVAYALRFEGLSWTTGANLETALTYTALALPLKFALFFALGLYGRLWRYASAADMSKILEATGAAWATTAILGIWVLPYSGLTAVRVPISVSFLDGFFTLAAIAAPRILIKGFSPWPIHRTAGGRRALIAGAGKAGEMVLKEILANPDLGLTPVGFVDDDRAKHAQRLGGLPVFGALASIAQIVAQERIEEVIIALPRAPGHVVRNVLRAATEAKLPTRTVPGLFEIVSGRVKVSALRNVEIQDLLRREPVKTDLEALRALFQGRTVLITGAGGSIGSELARQVALLAPRELILLGNAASEIFAIFEELQAIHPDLTLAPNLADVRDLPRMRSLFREHRPHVVFHAAAHKHVPLMEDNTAEAITNNVLGTRHLLECAVEWNTERFVFVSTDKAVRPVNVMGATKRVAEMLVQQAATRHNRNFMAVRFGNVLGSRGSVVPIFLRQIREGGPVTITHPEMRRFFMTIPEAVQLVLQAGTMGRGGELFALDMGEPVRILDLAADLIRLSGLAVGTDIEIRYTGMRPGERLHEEVFFKGEDVMPTGHPKVLRTRNDRLPHDLQRRVEILIDATRSARRAEQLRMLLQWVVPECRLEPTEEAGARAAARPAEVRRRWRRPTEERRSGGDRRDGERRAGVERLGHGRHLAAGERRRGRERRCGIDRRAAVPAPTPSEVEAV